MRYIRADIQQVNRSEWRGYIEEFHIFFEGTTKALAETAAREALEATEGLTSYEVIWVRC
ncbi:hypothetical protein SEA_WATERT_53 [Microbacterium phage WaterT]|nr:hypothetical protein SEA_WATERT_53 [Microbacterium phage WaterT]QDK01452.1 hypothetical protein SEA_LEEROYJENKINS_55 [Microbacterium phage LeeroyJenkins]QOC59375.1 hypothetical protein SEA_LIFES_49 [Microbacterium phage Lifes]